jgi:hypothetical protein
MPAEVLNLGLSQRLIEPFSGIAGLWPLNSRANIAQAIAQLPQRLQCGASHRVYLNMPDFSVLTSCDCNDSPL